MSPAQAVGKLTAEAMIRDEIATTRVNAVNNSYFLPTLVGS
jgi:hypothetical protein